MKKLKWLSFLIAVFSILVFGNRTTDAYAAENSTNTTHVTDEFTMTYDIFQNQDKKVKFVKKNGEEVTISIEPVQQLDLQQFNQQPVQKNTIRPLSTVHYLPFGTTTYKVSANTPYLGMSFYVKVYVPSNISYSKITSAYSPDYWVMGGYLSGQKLTRYTKSATYSADAIWFGGLGAANVWLKGSLSGNVITTTCRM